MKQIYHSDKVQEILDNQSPSKFKRKVKEIIIGGVALTAIVAAVAASTLNYWNREVIKPEDFDKAKWLPYNNITGRIWTCYTNENIPHHQLNWKLYEEKVREKNNNNLEGTILLPDLDNNYFIGK